MGRSASVLQLGESLLSPNNRLATRSSLVGKRIGQIGEEEGGYGSTQSSPGYGGGLRAPSRANAGEFGGTTGQSASFGSYLSTTRERERERELEREREASYYSAGGGVRRLNSVSGQGGVRHDSLAGGLERGRGSRTRDKEKKKAPETKGS